MARPSLSGPLPSGLIRADTLLRVRQMEPISLELADFDMLGKAVNERSFQSPFGSVLRFPSHALEVQPGTVQLLCTEPTESNLIALSEATVRVVEDYLGRRSIHAVGRNIMLRRRSPHTDAPPREMLLAMLRPSVSAVFSHERLEMGLEFHFAHPLASQVNLEVEPSRVDDLGAVYFAYNFHSNLPQGLPSYDALLEAVWMDDRVLAEVERITARFLEAAAGSYT